MIEKAKIDYMDGMKYKDIAAKYEVSINTVKSWVSRNGWAKEKKGAHKKTEGAYKKEEQITITRNEDKIKEKIIEEVVANSDLTDKQQLFCIYYLKYFNATKAYQKAYECDYITANVNGSRLLGKASIKEEIERLKAARLKGVYLDSKDILQKYIDIAFADITDYLKFGKKEVPVMGMFGPVVEDGEPLMQEVNYVDFKESSCIDGTIISEVSQGKEGIKIKLLDKMKALDWLSKNLPSVDESSLDLDRELMLAKVEKEKIQVKMLQLEFDSITGEDIDQESIDNFIAATKPNKEEVKGLFESED